VACVTEVLLTFSVNKDQNMSGHRNADNDGGSDSGLSEAIDRLNDEVHTLRIAVDELRVELAYELRKLREAINEGTLQPKPPFHLHSMPLDPTVPDFHERVNAVVPSPVDSLPNSFAELILRLTEEAATSHLAADEWIEDQDFPLGEVVEIDTSILDWFNEYLVIVKREGDWFLADDGEGWFYLLWRRDENCYVRLLTEEQRQKVTQLTGLAPNGEHAEEGGPPYSAPCTTADEQPRQMQRSLCFE
jgi:hypothetical protein